GSSASAAPRIFVVLLVPATVRSTQGILDITGRRRGQQEGRPPHAGVGRRTGGRVGIRGARSGQEHTLHACPVLTRRRDDRVVVRIDRCCGRCTQRFFVCRSSEAPCAISR